MINKLIHIFLSLPVAFLIGQGCSESSNSPTADSRDSVYEKLYSGGFAYIGGGSYKDETGRRIKVSSFYMDTAEVSNLDYSRYLWHTGRSSGADTNAYGEPLDTVSCDTTLSGDTTGCTERYSGFSPSDSSELPVRNISWKEAVRFAVWLTTEEMGPGAVCYDTTDWTCDITKPGFRLPASNEWEWAARGGPNAYQYGTSDGSLDRESVVFGEPGGAPQKTDSYKPNVYGIYHLSGNVAEFCTDVFQERDSAIIFTGVSESFVKKDTALPYWNFTEPGTGEYRIVRGGSYAASEIYCLTDHIDSMSSEDGNPWTGFRLVRTDTSDQKRLAYESLPYFINEETVLTGSGSSFLLYYRHYFDVNGDKAVIRALDEYEDYPVSCFKNYSAFSSIPDAPDTIKVLIGQEDGADTLWNDTMDVIFN
ncbi:MAG: formylglycine-generating enzyme family protein [Fibrobacterota bacterium]